MHESDPGKPCDCRNVCGRSTKRGACPCLVRGSFCTDQCTCGTAKQTCSNRPGSRGSKLSEKLGIALDESDDSDKFSDAEALVSQSGINVFFNECNTVGPKLKTSLLTALTEPGRDHRLDGS